MSIPERDISILIPTYRYRDKVVRAVQSALASGAGEVIVTDDRSGDGTIERLAEFDDPRLQVIENEHNLGLWENHLRALSRATRPWIKFIQADDYLLPGGLAAYAASAADGVAVVWGAPIAVNDDTGETYQTYSLSKPRRIDRETFQDACLDFGWLLGSPSYWLMRADVIERDPMVWVTAMSADMVVGSIAATRGDVVLLPPGAIGHGHHALQDSITQKAGSGLRRMARSLAYLRRRPEPGLRELANRWRFLNRKVMLRTAVKSLIFEPGARGGVLRDAWELLGPHGSLDRRDIRQGKERLIAASRFRNTSSTPFDLDRLLGREFAESSREIPELKSSAA